MADQTDSITTLAQKLATKGPVKVLPMSRQISLLFNGCYIARTTRAVYVWEHPYYPQLYIPADDFAAQPALPSGPDSDIASPSPSTSKPRSLKISATQVFPYPDARKSPLGQRWTLSVDSRSTNLALAFSSADTLANTPLAPLAGLVKVEFSAIDAWFEEDEQIFVHPRDPFKRVDIVPSRRRVRAFVRGVLVADSWRDWGAADADTSGGGGGGSAMHLFETGLPTRYYLPFSSLDPSVLRPSSQTSKCPYKGTAEYYSLEVQGERFENVVWFYKHPLMESSRIEGLYCFWAEKPGVQLELDGEMLGAPNDSPWANRGANDTPKLE